MSEINNSVHEFRPTCPIGRIRRKWFASSVFESCYYKHDLYLSSLVYMSAIVAGGCALFASATPLRLSILRSRNKVQYTIARNCPWCKALYLHLHVDFPFMWKAYSDFCLTMLVDNLAILWCWKPVDKWQLYSVFNVSFLSHWAISPR